MRYVWFILLALSLFTSNGFVGVFQQRLDSEQLIVVKTADFNAFQGQLRYYERDPATRRWVEQGTPFASTVGRKGLAWGAGLHKAPATLGPRKREGDGKSPAGIFPIGAAFGSRPVGEVGPLRVPYLQADSSTFCVDDPASPQYNRIVNTDTLKANWASAERMLIPDYEYGLVVEYNYPNRIGGPARPGDGSCIFIHLWRGRQIGTAGCTAMSARNLLPLLRWLDARKRPLLVQMPEREYARWRSMYELP